MIKDEILILNSGETLHGRIVGSENRGLSEFEERRDEFIAGHEGEKLFLKKKRRNGID